MPSSGPHSGETIDKETLLTDGGTGGTQGVEFGSALVQLWYVWVIGIIAAVVTLYLGVNDQLFPDTYAEVFYAFIFAVFTIGVFGYGAIKMREKTRKYKI